MKRTLSALLFLVVFLIGVSFALKNPQGVQIHYYFGIDLGPFPVSLVVIVVLLMGVLLGGLVASFPLMSRHREVRRIRRRMEDMEQELGRLRKLPLKDEP
ncbi:lipopolysaccharide assembly protein LapA domain-containing protein [Thiohalorhabdus sp. Cl-TMA]|uniref:Lipopolysaccharide assembly protein LapA domain-containing protein n=1 Tax=Thiohalorhabdus methylotrophus TaxID=3242694 RepID=A0ABV4TYE8_9GAMM